jgi:site-specific recombinase XerD
MDNTKLKNVIKKYQQHLVVDHGIGRNTVDGYARSLSIALRRMRKFAPKPAEIKQHILWMHTRNYSYSHIVNTSIAIEHYAKQRGITIKIGRPRKPRRVIKDILTESEVSRIIQSARNLREKAIVCLLAYSGMRNREVCNLMVRELDLGFNRVICHCRKKQKGSHHQHFIRLHQGID